jgi:hypothetical protein
MNVPPVAASGDSEGQVILACPACDGSVVSKSFGSNRGQVDRCQECGLFFVPDPITPSGQEKLFYSTIDESKYVEYFEPFRKGQYRLVLQRAGLAPGSTLLDVGASYGWMVEVALELGYEAFGIEPGEAAVSDAIRARVTRSSLEDFSISPTPIR